MRQRRATLADLRRRIDRIDAAIHALLIQRTVLVERVKDLKKNERVKIRPGREAEIIYRLIRRHKGPFPAAELVRIWREIIVATLRFEGPFSVAVFAPHGHGGIWDLARDQYGSFTPMARHPGARAVIRAVTAHRAAVGVLPLPAADEDEPWWPDLMPNPGNIRARVNRRANARLSARRAHQILRPDPRFRGEGARAWIIAKLPFTGASNARGAEIGAFAIAPAMPDPSGRDRTCLGLATDDKAGREAIARAFAKARLGPPDLIGVEDSQVPGGVLWFADVPGYVREDDPRLAALAQALVTPSGVHSHIMPVGMHSHDDSFKRLAVLGAYAEPLRPADLTPTAKRKKNARRP